MGKRTKRTTWCIVTVIAVLLLIRFSLPYGAQWYINRTLEAPGGYSGHVGDVDLMLWRGAYSLEDITIIQDGGSTERPLFKAQEIEFSLLWSALMDGAIVGDILLTAPEINFIDSQKDDSKDQTGESENWLNLADQLFPLKVDHLQIIRGKIAFYNPDSVPPIDLAVHDINGEARNLVNSRDLSKNLVATFDASAQTAKQGTLTIAASLNPSTKKPTFDMDVQANDVALVNFENLLDTYAPFDLEAGTLELALEIASDDGYVEGYIKPILKDVTVFSWKGDIEEDNDGFFEGMVEMASAFITELFENQSKDQIATRIPIEGQLNEPETALLPAIGAVLKNAFIAAMKGDVEKSIELKDATRQKQEAKQDAAEDNDTENNTIRGEQTPF
ncbi:DUF748 domain-containing protein [Salinimonas iocasae]|uniref:DUF748 domain-containing protein n=1 Tax=Salinimonas iocasae TaxID=2572577 RepID=A0A5B7YI52_9ALTE|nr:DUF748 domain-containing protein [Salinimonas iocasae]QCZ95010.1 DUF748 domain-containing protein [Salinimonas iocasae]